MKQFLFIVAILFALRAGSSALTPLFAQTYGYGSYPVCTTLTQDLGYGMSDSYGGDQVSQLQRFLIQKGYLAISAPTGYFGSLTQAAVRNFQSANGLPATGYVTSATRSAINQQSCTGTSYPYDQSLYGTGYAGQYYYGYNQNMYGYYAAPVITSLSANSAPAGSSLTIYGTGFDTTNNTVYVNGTALSGQSSYNGTSITIIVPTANQNCSSYNYYYPYQTYCPYQDQATQVYVVSSRGTSNMVPFTITSSYYGSSYYNPYNYNYGYTTSVTPTISSVTPTSGGAGTVVTVYGSGFSYENNTVFFGSYTLSNIPSYNGTSLTFTVPTQSQYYCAGYCDPYQNASSVSLSVRNLQGYTSNYVTFSLYATTNYGGYYNSYYNYGYQY